MKTEEQKEKRKTYNKKWVEQNADKRKASRQKWRDANLEKIKADKHEWRKQPHAKFMHGKRSANKREYEWNLTFDEYLKIIESNSCHYCEQPLSETGWGLDRMNDEPFYTTENSVPCCGRCNKTFIAGFSYNEKLTLGLVLKTIDIKRSSKR